MCLRVCLGKKKIVFFYHCHEYSGNSKTFFQGVHFFFFLFFFLFFVSLSNLGKLMIFFSPYSRVTSNLPSRVSMCSLSYSHKTPLEYLLSDSVQAAGHSPQWPCWCSKSQGTLGKWIRFPLVLETVCRRLPSTASLPLYLW